jgi:hypothetical protein
MLFPPHRGLHFKKIHKETDPRQVATIAGTSGPVMVANPSSIRA